MTTETPMSGDAEERRVSTLELFFDLVFVFTITQLTALVQRDQSPEGAWRIVLVFVLLFWMYGGYAWLTNQVPPDVPARRLLLIAGMAGFLICAIAVPEAFDTGGVTFGIGYLIVVLVHAGLYAQAYGPAALRFVPLNMVGAICVLIGGLLPIPVRYVLWVVPIGLQYLATVRTRTADEGTRAGFDLHVPHFVERHGLLLLIAIGESVVAIGGGMGAIPLDLGVFSAALLGLALAAALWWSYFERDEARAEASLARGTLLQRTGMALHGYFYAYIPMLLGIITLSAGVRLTIGRLGAQLDLGSALLVGGGVALYLAGSAAFRRALGIGGVMERLAAAAVAVACVLVGTGVAAGAELVALVVLLMVMLALEARAATE